MNFNQRLAAYRKSKGISQESLADMLGVSRQAVSKWETGESQPEMGNLIAICKILQVSPDDLIGYSHENGSSDDSADNGGRDVQPTENLDKNVKSKRKVMVTATIIIACLIIGGAVGFKIGRASEMQSPKSLLDGMDSMRINGLVYEFIPDDPRGDVRLTFIPGVADESLQYEVVRIDKDGGTKTFPAEYSDGTCTAFVETVKLFEVTFTAKVSDGEYVLSQGLIKIEDLGDHTYMHEEIWK